MNRLGFWGLKLKVVVNVGECVDCSFGLPAV